MTAEELSQKLLQENVNFLDNWRKQGSGQTCGCTNYKGKYQCTYHEGFEDGLDALITWAKSNLAEFITIMESEK